MSDSTSSDLDPPPTVFVLFGATGDLAARMVLPAFATLALRGLLPKKWRIVGNGRGDVSHDEFRDHVRQALTEHGPDLDDAGWDDFASHLLFAGGGFDEGDPGSLWDVIKEAEQEVGTERQLVHYVALPPAVFPAITRALDTHGLVEGSRVVYEKPFGTSPENFTELDELVHQVYDEDDVFRIDHFLGKEATQELHVLRFGNPPMHGVWNREHIEQVQIDVPETLDVADRAGFYDATGAVLDMLVTHLFQVAAEVAMEPPTGLDATALQDAREGVISAFRPLDPADVVLGQFDGYSDIDGIADDSTTDTFVAARMWVDTDRWHGVPFLLRTGKRMGMSAQQVSLVFRRPTDGPLTHLPDAPPTLMLSLSGDGVVRQRMVVLEPGPGEELTTAETTLDLGRVAGGEPLPPYSRLIHDVLRGDRSLFTRSDGLKAAWNVIAPLLAASPTPIPYAPGSMGPDVADALPGGHGWVVQNG